MCGIAGFQGEFDGLLLERMTDAVAHRGPDGKGAIRLGAPGPSSTGLGHRRLAIIDLSEKGNQPMAYVPDGASDDGGVTLVYNGEIYNYRELRASLEGDGEVFRSASDSEVLLRLYARDGLEMFSRLNGIFAFAIHDGRTSGRPEGVPRGALLLARDHLGVKPLYYAETPSGFLFASEIKALTQCRELSLEIDPFALHQMLAYLWTPAPRTMLAGVRKLEPGSGLIVGGGRLRKQFSFYTIPYAGRAVRRDAGEVAPELAEKVSAAVTRQLVADVPVGAFLSGGLDSSAVVAMMRRAWPDKEIQCFSIGFEAGQDADGNPADLPYARRVARHLGVTLNEIVVSPSMIDRLPEMVRLLDEPQADPAPINALLISERARAMGIPVLLSGAGGDDLFTGYRRHWALQFERRWSWLPAAARLGIGGAANRMASGGAFGQSHPLLRRLAKMFAYAGEPAERRLISYFWWSTDAVRRALYTPDLAALVGTADVAEPLMQSLAAIPAEHDRLQRMLYLESRHFLADHNLNYTDRAGMAVGVEIRVPFLDLELVDYATTIDSSLKQRGRTGKAILKQAMEPFLPRDVIYRPKSGFGAPLRRWLRAELKDMVQDLLGPESLRNRGYFDPGAVARLIDLDRRGAVDGAYTVFALMCFELWCREFIDTQG
jgi:asparagine synthase (glutamine-hydrolysing)